MAALHKNLGLILAQSGDTKSAIEELRIAQKLIPDDGDVQFSLNLFRRRAASEEQVKKN